MCELITCFSQLYVFFPVKQYMYLDGTNVYNIASCIVKMKHNGSVQTMVLLVTQPSN